MRSLNLSLKLPLFVVLAVLLTAGSGGVLAIFIGRSALRAQALEVSVSSVQTYVSAIGLYLDNARSVLESTAGLAAADVPTRDLAVRILKHTKVFEYVMLLRADGLVYLLEPHNLEIRLSRRDLAFTAWYKELIRNGQTVVSDLHISTATQRPTVVIATPVRGAEGRMVGIWAAGLKLEQLSRIGHGRLESATPQRYGYVTDGRGLIIAHQAEPRYAQEQTDFSAVPSVRAALAGQRGAAQFFHPTEREEKLGAYVPIPGSGWVAVYEVPTQVAFAPIKGLTRSIALASAGLAVLLGLLGVGIVRQVTGPLARLTTGAERIGAGDLTQRIEVRTGDELGRLGDAFNRMATELECRVAGLSALNAVGAVVNEAVELEQMLNRTLEEGLRLAGVEAGAVLLLDEEAEELVLVAHRGLSDEFVQAAQRLKLGEGLAGRAAQTGQPLVMGDIAEYCGALKPFVEKDRIRSAASVPLLGRTGVIGVVNLVTRNPHYFDAAGLELLTSLGRQVAVGVEKARLYEEVRRHADQLEERVQERTAALEQANRELEAFSYSISHDLRAPLRAIDGFSRILLEEYTPHLPEEARRYLHQVRDGAQQMGHLVDDLLAFSRLSRQSLKMQPVAPADLVHQILEDLRAQREGRHVELSVGDLPSCEADPALLRQVFINLLDNALKFTRGRDPARIEIGSTDISDCRLPISDLTPAPTQSAIENRKSPIYFVRDNGVGFDMRYADKLFGVFQRLHRAEEYEGTGVGLAIVHRVIHRHGGRVWAEAAVDKGATFYFTI